MREKRDPQPGPEQASGSDRPGRIVLIGSGASGFAVAEMLHRRGLAGV